MWMFLSLIIEWKSVSFFKQEECRRTYLKLKMKHLFLDMWSLKCHCQSQINIFNIHDMCIMFQHPISAMLEILVLETSKPNM